MRFSTHFILLAAAAFGAITSVAALPTAEKTTTRTTSTENITIDKGTTGQMVTGRTTTSKTTTKGHNLGDLAIYLGKTISTRDEIHAYLSGRAPASTIYGPAAAKNFKIGPLTEVIADDFKGMLSPLGVDVAKQQFKTFNAISKPATGTTYDKMKTVVGAKYCSTGMIVETIYVKKDTNAVRIPTAELMYQGAKAAGSKPTWVIQQFIENAQTEKFIAAAFKALGGKSGTITFLKLDSGNAVMQKWFEILLGSDNGRGTQAMCNFHPEYFSAKSGSKTVLHTVT
ncbi:hypothetical protein B0J14DRAFT_707704 [Halenospora varia]|nr:hypothetical protein B0J14DRAFT_707704 [Halenospora varia]